MLKTRVLTALTLAPLVVLAVYLLPLWAFALFVGGILCLAMYEWAALAGLSSPAGRASSIGLFAAAALALWWFPQGQQAVLYLAAAAWVVATGIVLFHPASVALVRSTASVGAFGLIMALGAWIALVTTRAGEHGGHWVMWLLLICWAADAGAYFAGRAFGRRKLALSISPGKTWEGAIGGLIVTLAVCGGLLAYAGQMSWGWVAMIVVLVAISVVGDLFESVLKRAADIKDSGSLLPGHGGVLDRIDSVLAVAPTFAVLGALVR